MNTQHTVDKDTRLLGLHIEIFGNKSPIPRSEVLNVTTHRGAYPNLVTDRVE
jgi:hypothetical protein